MRLVVWTFLLMFVTNAVQGYDDESILERIALEEEEDEDETKTRPHQQREGWRVGGGRDPHSSASLAPPPPPPVPDSVHWKEGDYESEMSSSLRKGRGGGRWRGAAAGGGGGRHQPPSPSLHALTTAATAETRKVAAVQHHLLPSPVASTADDRLGQQRRHKPSRGRSNGSRGLVAHSVCPSQTEWKRLREARDMNNTVVEVFQPNEGGQRKRGDSGPWTQWFYIVSCRNHVFQSQRQCQDCCIGIDHSRYASSCEQRQSYVLAYIRRPWQKRFVWDYILINSSCNCAITSIHDDL